MRIVTEDGFSITDIDIGTDGGYALPLLAEGLEIFRSMVSGGVSVSQTMTYQLTILAQYRVINRYGSMSKHGPMGTLSIITVEDVSRAYRWTLDAAKATCFRDGDLTSEDRADLSDLLISEGEIVEIDLAAVYA